MTPVPRVDDHGHPPDIELSYFPRLVFPSGSRSAHRIGQAEGYKKKEVNAYWEQARSVGGGFRVFFAAAAAAAACFSTLGPNWRLFGPCGPSRRTVDGEHGDFFSVRMGGPNLRPVPEQCFLRGAV